MLTLKVVAADSTHWLPDVTNVVQMGGATMDGAHVDTIATLQTAGVPLPEPSDECIYSVLGGDRRDPDQRWYGIAVQLQVAGDKRHRFYIIEERTAYLLGPDGRTLDRI